MNTERIDAVWVEEHQLLSVDELGGRWGLSVSQLHEFIDHGILEPTPGRSGEEGFRIEQLPVVRTACRLQQELELDPHAVGVVLELVQRVRALEDELRWLRAHVAGGAATDPDNPIEAKVTSPRPS